MCEASKITGRFGSAFEPKTEPKLENLSSVWFGRKTEGFENNGSVRWFWSFKGNLFYGSRCFSEDIMYICLSNVWNCESVFLEVDFPWKIYIRFFCLISKRRGEPKLKNRTDFSVRFETSVRFRIAPWKKPKPNRTNIFPNRTSL